MEPQWTGDWKTRAVFYMRIAILILGVIVVAVGYTSHLESDWLAPLPNVTNHVYEICRFSYVEQWLQEPCPRVAIEKYFVAVITICLILSLLDFIASFFLGFNTKPLVDILFHGIAFILLLIAGLFYVVSAKQIRNFLEGLKTEEFYSSRLQGMQFRITEKIVAGVLAILLSFLYAGVGVTTFISYYWHAYPKPIGVKY